MKSHHAAVASVYIINYTNLIYSILYSKVFFTGHILEPMHIVRYFSHFEGYVHICSQNFIALMHLNLKKEAAL